VGDYEEEDPFAQKF